MPRTPGRSCAGKRRHQSRNEPHAHRRTLIAEGSDGSLLSVYRCPICNFFHVGHVAKGAPR